VGREETVPPVGGRGYVQVWWAITKPGTVWQYQRETAAGRGERVQMWEFWPGL